MDARVEAFLEMMAVERDASPHTLSAYGRDLADLAACLDGEQARTALFDRVTERLDLDAAGKKPYRDLQSHATVEVPAGVPGLAPRFSRIVQAIDLADVVLFVVDATVGATATDEAVAESLRPTEPR